MQEFLNLIIDTIKNEDVIIDEMQNKEGYKVTQDFLRMLNNLSINSGICNILPFFISYLYQDFDSVPFNGVLKKLNILKILSSL